MAERDDTLNGPIDTAPCWFCARRSDPFDETCIAFPDGIPHEILLGENDHTKPVDGDRGLTFLEGAR